jgi:beta-N-acetylhexosaminidase
MPKTTALDLRRQVGQLLIMGFDGLSVESKLRTTLSSLQPGGVILFVRNIESPRQTWGLLRDCQRSVPLPMFLCVDLEGGRVDRLQDVIGAGPSAEQVSATRNSKLFRMHGEIVGLEARAMGFNTDFAPVFDLGLEGSRSVLSSRTASANPAEVVDYAREFLLGLKTAQVLGCGKHFPGLGEANLDTHKDLPSVKKPWKKLWAEDLVPYRQLHSRLPFIMVAHACYPDVTKDKLPASLSHKWITDVLRKKIGYRGLIVCDDLEMGGVLAAGPIEEAAVETVRAGADIFLVCRNQEFVWRTYEAVLLAAEKDRKFAAQVAQAAARVSSVKRRARQLHQFAARPGAKVIATLKKIIRDFSQAVEEFKA